MRDYFTPWRRRIGVLTLVLGCVFAIGWIRSFHSADWIEGSTFKFVSIDGALCWEHTKNLHEFMRKLAVVTVPAASFYNEYGFSTPTARWNQNLFGFGWKDYGGQSRIFGKIVYTSHYSVYRVPYWSIVLPLTLISCWLLLSQPCPRKSKPSQERLPESAVYHG